MEQSWFLLYCYKCVRILYASEILYFAMVVTLMVFLYFLYSVVKRIKQLKTIPGPNALSMLLRLLKTSLQGTINSESLHTAVSVAHLFDKEGMYLLWLGGIPLVIIYKAETMEFLMSSNNVLHRAPDYQFVAPAFRNGLFTCPENQWRQRRRLLNPAFNVRILEDCMPIFNRQSRNFVKKVKSLLSEMPVDVAPLLQHCSLDIICEAAMGVDIGSQVGKNTEFVQATHSLLQIVQQRILQIWLHPNFLFYNLPIGRKFRKSLKVIDDFTTKIILSRKEEMLKDSQVMQQIQDGEQFVGSRKKFALLDLLLYNHLFLKNLNEIDVLGEVITFMVAGHDTSGLTLAWALFLIGHDPRVQENIHRELDELFPGDKERPVTLEDIKELPYLKCVIKETLRLYPPGSYVGRLATNDLVINGYKIPSGTRCIGLIYQLHRDPRYFPKPEAFIPERFLPNNPDIPTYAYIPFSAGPKVCIGQRFAMYELLTILADILRNFSLKSIDARDKIDVSLEFVLVPSHPLRVTFTPR